MPHIPGIAPHRKHAHIQYPFAQAGDFAELHLGHDAVVVTQDPAPSLAFYRDNLMGFLPQGGMHWIGRRQWAEGEMDAFMSRIGIERKHQLEVDDFWKAYLDEMTHPRVLLDLAAREAMESLRGL